MWQTDSIAAGHAEELAAEEAQQAHHARPQSPWQVISALPADATPAQQDSAVQANFQPKQVRVNTRVDTLTLFGLKKVEGGELSTMRYEQESPFAGSTYYHPEEGSARPGVAGDPVPYTVSGDNVVTGMLLFCFLMAMISFSNSRRFIERQFKSIFRAPIPGTTTMGETTSEVRFQVFMVLQTCLLMSIFAFYYSLNYVASTYVLSSQYQLIAIFFGMFVAYYVVKTLVYEMVNWTFFDKKKNGQWSKFFLFINSMLGVALFPLILLLAYFDLSMENAVTYIIILIILVKLLTFYKSHAIFFKGRGSFLQIFLYFCALEMVPLFALWGIFMMIGSYLKINI